MTFLLARGASVSTASGGAKSSSVINACLANGRPRAAELLADRANLLDLEAAAGLGRLDLVKRFFNADGSLTGGATDQQTRDEFSWACEYGRTEVGELPLRQPSLDVRARLDLTGRPGCTGRPTAGTTKRSARRSRVMHP